MLLFNDLMLFGYHFRIKRCSVRLYLRLFVGGLMSYLRYLCLFAHSGVQHILRCVFLFCLFSSCVLCMQYCQFLWISHSWLSPSVFSNVYWYPSKARTLIFIDICGECLCVKWFDVRGSCLFVLLILVEARTIYLSGQSEFTLDFSFFD